METPGIQVKGGEGDEEGLRREEATRYRALVAKANDLAQDRVDIRIHNIWSKITDGLRDLCFSDFHQPGYHRSKSVTVLRGHDQKKNWHYLEACHDHRQDFTQIFALSKGRSRGRLFYQVHCHEAVQKMVSPIFSGSYICEDMLHHHYHPRQVQVPLMDKNRDVQLQSGVGQWSRHCSLLHHRLTPIR